jgi:hypothetical protein
MGIPLIFIVAGLPLMTLSLASTLTDAPNCTGTPTLNGESPIVPGVDVPLGLVTTPPKLKHGFAIEQGAVDGPPLTIHVQNNVRDPAFPQMLHAIDFELFRRPQALLKHKQRYKKSNTDL